MKTKSEIIAELKAEHPTLRSGSDEIGYTELNPADYEATIQEWADNELEREAKAVADKAATDKAEADKAALLAKLGITAEEAKLLLS